LGNKYTKEDYQLLINILYEDIKSYTGHCKNAYFDWVKDVIYYYGLEYKSNKTKNMIKNKDSVLYKIMYNTNHKDLPLEINNPCFGVKQVIKWRLEIGK